MRSFIFFVLPFGAYSSSCVDSAAQATNDASLLAEDASLLQSIHVRGKSDPVPEEDEHGRKYKEEYKDYRHRMDAQAQQVTAKVTFDPDKVKLSDFGKNIANGDFGGYLDWAKYSQHRVCVASSDDAVADLQAEHVADGEDALGFYVPEFTLDEPICFNKLWIGYLAGFVNCRGKDSGKSYFGCDEDSIGLTLAKKNGDEWDVVFPKAVKDSDDGDANKLWNQENIKGYGFVGHDHADWYTIDGYEKSSTGLVLELNDRHDDVDRDGGVFLPRGTYRLWYHEDLTGGTEGDNSGVACYHLDFSLCQGTQQSSWSANTAAPPVEEDAR